MKVTIAVLLIGVPLWGVASPRTTGSTEPGTAALPHELERTRVVVALASDGTFVVDVVNDPYWLLWRLDPEVELADTTDISAPERDQRLAELAPTFAEHVSLNFDDTRVALTAEYIAPSAEPSDPALRVARVRLRGTVPEGAASFGWTYSLVEDPYPMLIYDRGGEPIIHWVQGPVEAGPFELATLRPMTRLEAVRTYLALGFTHILPKGLDHILFVSGIFLLTTRLRPMVVQVTMFTLAHTITLALSVLGVLSLPPAIIEPLIAASIVYVAVENLITSELKARRVALVFGFGLLHGMGFAGVLSELGLPRYQLATGLVSFNLGVEAGQLAVLALLFATVGMLHERAWYRRRVVWPLSALIAAVGLYWTVARIVATV